MGKSLSGKELGLGICQRKDGAYFEVHKKKMEK